MGILLLNVQYHGIGTYKHCVVVSHGVNRGEVNVDIFAADEIASGVSPSTELLTSPSYKISMSDFKAEVSLICFVFF